MTQSAPLASAEPLQTPAPWASGSAAGRTFFDSLRRAAEPLLICDYDGTLAPFHIDKMQACPYPGIVERLHRIAAGRTRLAFVSGRPIHELLTLLPLAAQVEVWGMHGREHRTADGSYTLMQASPGQRAALDQAAATLEQQGLGSLLERKAASLAVHWRTLDPARDPARLEQVQRLATQAFAPHAGRDALALLPFDGGVELRAEDRTKAHATEALLGAMLGAQRAAPPATAPGAGSAEAAAFLGDDLTDEDAFRAIRSRGGLALLVREAPRASHAHFQLRPPGELLAFLDSWLGAAAATGSETP